MEQPNPPLARFTFVGRMLLLTHLIVGVSGSVLYICDFIPKMPAGRYPIMMFVVPVGMACFFSFLAIAWLLERIGIQVYKR